jgi:hypothetical protein
MQVAAHLHRQESVCLRQSADVDVAAVAHDDGGPLCLFCDGTDLLGMSHPRVAGRDNDRHTERPRLPY